jgi:ankyrin repeat protein
MDEQVVTFFKAIRSGDGAQVAAQLRSRPELLRAPGKQGQFPLQEAADSGHAEVVKVLLTARADVDAAGSAFDGQPPLLIAVWATDDVILRALAVAGADLNAADNKRRNALHACVTNGNDGILQYIVNPSSFDSSVEHGIDVAAVAAKDADGETPLHLLYSEAATSRRRVEFTKEFHSLFPSEALRKALAVTNHEGKTPLHCLVASSADDESLIMEVATLATELGANWNVKDSHGRTPLADASRDGRCLTVKLFATHGASSINTPDSKGNTCAHHAARTSHALVMLRELHSVTSIDWLIRNHDGKTPADLLKGTLTEDVAAELGVPEGARSQPPMADTPAPSPPVRAGDFSGRGTKTSTVKSGGDAAKSVVKTGAESSSRSPFVVFVFVCSVALLIPLLLCILGDGRSKV